VFQTRVLRRIFGPRREEVAGGCRRLHNEELHNFYISANIIKVIKSRRMRWARQLACMGEMINAYNILVDKPVGKSLLEDTGDGWEDNIRMNLRERGREGVDWMHLA
jgi:hypothetical protein